MSVPRVEMVKGAMKLRLHPAHSPEVGMGSAALMSSLVLSVVDDDDEDAVLAIAVNGGGGGDTVPGVDEK
jgi:hypothetical protein